MGVFGSEMRVLRMQRFGVVRPETDIIVRDHADQSGRHEI